MAGNAKKTKKAGRSKQASSPSAYAREALTEWRKAARFGAAALLASGGGATKAKAKSKEKPPLKERVNPATTEKGGRIGDAADNLLSRLGFLGKAASKFSLGSRAVDKVVPDAVSKLQPSGEGGSAGDGSQGHPPVPIQESIELAVPLRAAFALATRIEDFPQWSDRIQNAEEIDETGVAVDLKTRGIDRSVEVEITDVQPPFRIEWEATEGHEHAGVLTFHELAPSLTHVELSLDVEPENPVQKLTRTIHLPERAIRTELHLFKAWAELWQEVEDVEAPEEPPEEPEEGEEFDEEPEGEFEEEPEDEFEEEEDFEDEEVDEEGEPAGRR
jgi:uncharacterized membrane protein